LLSPVRRRDRRRDQRRHQRPELRRLRDHRDQRPVRQQVLLRLAVVLPRLEVLRQQVQLQEEPLESLGQQQCRLSTAGYRIHQEERSGIPLQAS
jgi:hypothetical protein